MKMAALQLMQQKASKDGNKSGTPAITETSEKTSETNADVTQPNDSTPSTEVPAESTGQSDSSTTSQAAVDGEEHSSKPSTNGLIDPATTPNGECKSPLEGKELEETIPGLAQAKELAETLVAEDGSGIGTSKTKSPEADVGRSRGSVTGGSSTCSELQSTGPTVPDQSYVCRGDECWSLVCLWIPSL